MSSFEPVLTKHIHEEDCHTLAFYRSVGGYKALEKVLSMVVVELDFQLV